MTRFPGLDPEVLADLRDRERSAHDLTRARRARNPFADAAKVEHVEHWPCRGGCGAMIGVTAETCEAFAILSAERVRRGDRPLAKAQAVWCPDCKCRDEELAQAQRDGERARRRPHQQTAMILERPDEAGKGRP